MGKGGSLVRVKQKQGRAEQKVTYLHFNFQPYHPPLLKLKPRCHVQFLNADTTEQFRNLIYQLFDL
jgi:hypothetical protein